MKTAVTSVTNNPGSAIDSRFGRAAFFALFDHETKEWTFIDNSADLSLSQGAGIQAAKKVINAGADSLITSNVGPKAYDLLVRSGIEIYSCPQEMTLTEAITARDENKLQRLDSANQESHW